MGLNIRRAYLRTQHMSDDLPTKTYHENRDIQRHKLFDPPCHIGHEWMRICIGGVTTPAIDHRARDAIFRSVQHITIKWVAVLQIKPLDRQVGVCAVITR